MAKLLRNGKAPPGPILRRVWVRARDLRAGRLAGARKWRAELARQSGQDLVAAAAQARPLVGQVQSGELDHSLYASLVIAAG